MGLIELATGRKTPWLDEHRGRLMAFANGMTSDDGDFGSRLMAGASNLSKGYEWDMLRQKEMKAEQERLDAINAQSAKQNQTINYMRNNGFGELADQVEAGFVPIGEAYKLAMQGPAKRETAKDANGRLRHIDDGSFVFEDVEFKPDQKEAFGNERDLRKDYYGTDVVKTYNDVRDAYERVRASASAADGPGDVALIFNYMKMLDPGSVVREGEFATAENAGGVGAQVTNIYNRILSGERLPPQLREKFVNMAEALYAETSGNLGSFNDQYGGILDNWQVSRDNVLITPEQYDPLQFGQPATPALPQQPQSNEIDELLQFMTPEERALFNKGTL